MLTLSILSLVLVVLLSACISKWIIVAFNLLVVLFGVVGITCHFIALFKEYMKENQEVVNNEKTV